MVERLHLVSAKAVKDVLKYFELIPEIEHALKMFSARRESGIIQPVRSVLHIPAVDGILGVMPAYSQAHQLLATKLLTFFPHNHGGIETHNAVIVLFHHETGVPFAIVDGDTITAYRTAAASAAATKHLVSGNPQKLAILGSGVQARSHFHALTSLFNFEKVTIWNHRPEKANALAKELGTNVLPVTKAREAVDNADVIVTVTSATTPILHYDWVKPGAHINAIGSCRSDWQEISTELMQKAVVYVDSIEAALKESGDIIKSNATIACEIGEVIAGKAEARCNETTLFKSLGIAIEDAVAANIVIRKLGILDQDNSEDRQ